MKHAYTSVLAVLCLSTSAQQVRTGFPAHPISKNDATMPAANTMPAPRAKNLDYYAEDFTSSLNGWTVVNNVGNLDWAWTDVGPGTTTSTYPVPALATNTGGWAIIDDDFLGQNGVETDTWLVSPVIDLSAAPPFLKLEFEQYFQEFQNDTTFIGVTVNGGQDWNWIALNDDVGRDGRPNPELMDVNISDWVALGPSTVQIAFRYLATWDYGWQVDNVRITDLEANDMALLNTHFTAFDFTNTGFSDIEYSIYPQEQVRPMLLHADVKNKGYAQQTGINFNVEVVGPGGSEYTGSELVGDQLPGETDSVANEGFTPSALLGTYEVSFGVVADQVDDNPDDNDKTMAFQVSADVFAHDDGAVTNRLTQGINNVGDQFEVGNYYEFVNDQDLLSIRVALHENTAVGTLVYGIVYDDQNPPVQIDQTDDYEVTAADLNPIGGSAFIDLPLNAPLNMVAGQVVLVMAGSYGGSEQVAFGVSGVSAAQVSIINYPTAGEIFFVTGTPMVRAIVENTTSVVEVAGIDGEVLVQPNPIDESAVLGFTTERSGRVRFELRDMTGRLVMNEDLGVRAAGAQQYRMDATGLAAGTYTYGLLLDGTRRTGKLVKQ